jgi:hypothetical protein
MKRFQVGRLMIVALCVLAMSLSIYPLTVSSAPQRGLQAVWERARQAGSYHFEADVAQTTTPLPTVSNVGRQTKRDRLHIEGQTDLPARQLEMTLWAGGGSVLDPGSGAQVRVEGNRAYVRQGDQPWQEVDDFTGLFAPRGDFMTFLVAAKNVVDQGTEARAGFNFSRYTFEIDGPGYAAYMRDQLERELTARGELPPGLSLDLSRQYVDMSGQGEVWIDSGGLPLRQILHLQFPEDGDQQVEADITVDFSGFGPGTALARSLQHGRRLRGLGLAGLWLASLALLATHRRSRTLYAAAVLAVILSMVALPLVQTAQLAAFYDRQAARAQDRDREGRYQESDMLEALNSLQAEPGPLQGPAALQAIAHDDGTDSDRDGMSDVEETLLGSDPLRNRPDLPVTLAENDGTDSDGDGLTDYVEDLLGTLPDFPDSDQDLLPDGLEVMGFQGADGQRRYTDPLEADTNRDGLADGLEYGSDLTRPRDTDGDGEFDVFERDNDNDGVPDELDLSPYVSRPEVFSADKPLELILDNLVPGRFTYVEFQLRPVNADHLWYAYNVLDWPEGDRRGHIQDDDGATFYDVCAGQAQPGRECNLSPDDNGDLKLVPMLELRIPDAADNLPEANILKDYGIAVQPLSDGGKAVYVPLQLTTDQTGGERVAFYGKMLYLPGPAWEKAHQVRLVWAIQALLDNFEKSQDGTLRYNDAIQNRVEVVHTYDDEWRLTGLNVRENHGVDQAIIYEDPAVDPDPNDDGALTLLAYGLEKTFLAGRTRPESDELDITPATLHQRFNQATNGDSPASRWNIPDTLGVVTQTFRHLDEALITTAMTETKALLAEHFTSRWAAAEPISPTLMFARLDRFRAFNLDEQIGDNSGLLTWQDHKLTLDLEPDNVKEQTLASLNWAPYQYDTKGDRWASYPIEGYWRELETRYASVFGPAYPRRRRRGCRRPGRGAHLLPDPQPRRRQHGQSR